MDSKGTWVVEIVATVPFVSNLLKVSYLLQYVYATYMQKSNTEPSASFLETALKFWSGVLFWEGKKNQEIKV